MSLENPIIEKRKGDRRMHPTTECAQRDEVEGRFQEEAAKIAALSGDLIRVEGKLDKNNTSTERILEILDAAEAFFNFANKAGNFLRWALGLGTAILAFYFTWKNGSAGK